jgi:hypothetical protein
MRGSQSQLTYSEAFPDSGHYVRRPLQEIISQRKFPVTLGVQPSCELIYLQAC